MVYYGMVLTNDEQEMKYKPPPIYLRTKNNKDLLTKLKQKFDTSKFYVVDIIKEISKRLNNN